MNIAKSIKSTALAETNNKYKEKCKDLCRAIDSSHESETVQ